MEAGVVKRTYAANEIAGKCACVRRDTSEELKAAGYDINEVCKEFVQMIFGEDA